MEVWKNIDGYDGAYQVSSQGRVRSTDRVDSFGRQRSGVILRGSVGKKQGYRGFNLSIGSKCKKHHAHQLVASAFLGDKGKGVVVDHIDGDKLNNNVENLQYITQRENIIKGKLCQEKRASETPDPGVYKNRSGNYVARKTMNGRRYHIGTFSIYEHAKLAYENFNGE